MSAFAGTLLGLPLIPPFNNPKTTGSHILQGVNFASAASGILDDTGRLYVGDPNTHTHHPALIVRHTLIKHGCHDQGNLFSMDDQIANFNITLQQLNSQLGDDTGSFLAESLFFLNMGSNDYVNNYLLPFSDKPKKYTPEAFSDRLIQSYKQQLMIVCLPWLPLECHNRSQYVFWDPYHPTDAFNAIVAKRVFQGTLQAVHPMNVHQLVET
ncbi:hypothetical protein B296_00013137 [Ensete ventricosum]|uniref:SGNH hydrolase-type esterase domain-containing protein n=1 Tax=Ensete ventricosum TaxID=4639 RepID=A0A427AE30_ENSVE|nr:hypothetical protein B296_00013137 [Ensete ventricosum]